MVCVRHPGRETGLRCTRCERPACPDCLREAAVGYQCVDCVNQGRRDTRGATTIAGAQPGGGHLITLVLIGLNVAAFVWNVIQAQDLARNFASESWQAGVLVPYLVASEPWRLVLSGFLHIGMVHLLLNMFALWMWGRDVEVVLGRARYVAVYLLSLLGGAVAVMVFDSPLQPVAGASGAIYGLLGSLLVLAMRLRLRLAPILMILGLNVLISFSIPNISWLGHFGGLAVGSLVTAAMIYAPRDRRALTQWGTVAAVTLFLLLVVLLRAGQIS